jgi:uncharacterized repeat protein (TIGR01451 family)
MYVPHNGDAEDHDASFGTLENEEKPAMKKPLLLRITAATLLLAVAGTATWWYCFRDAPDIQVVTPEDGENGSQEEGTDDIPGTLPEPGDEVFDRMTISTSGDLPVDPDNRESNFFPLGQAGDDSENPELLVPSSDSENYQLPAAPVSSGETYTIGDGTGSFTIDDQPLEPGNPAASDPGNDQSQLPYEREAVDRSFDEPDPFPSSIVQSTADLPENTASPDAPGRFQLEGKQIPTLSIEKHAPEEIQVNRMAAFTTTVKNIGTVAAHQVRVIDHIPRGTTLESTTPESSRGVDGSLIWTLGTLQPGEEATVSMKLIPRQEGEIGSVAMVNFQAEASIRTVSTRPQLVLQPSTAEQVLVGQDITVAITISNPGSGDATSVVLEADIPSQLRHAAGSELEYPIGTLRAGETRQLKLLLHATSAGLIRFPLVARGDGQLEKQHEITFEVIAPEIQVRVQGPRIRYLDRPATHMMEVGNSGTATARNISLVLQLPRGLKFISTDHHGRYETQQHAVYWQLEELPANVQDMVTVTTVPMEVGSHIMKLDGKADLGITDRFEHVMRVESVPQLLFTIADEEDPIEEGSDTTYEIRVINKGTRTATNVIVGASLPPQMQPIDGIGPTDARVDGQQIIFAPLDRLAPEAEVVYRVQVRGIQAGDHVIRVQIVSDDTRVAVSKEESTRVYADN